MSEKTIYLNKEQILNEYLAENEADKKKKLTVNIYEHSYSITCGKKILKSVQAIEGSFKDITEAHIYGYARVSTKGQAKDGNSLEAQEKALRENGAEVIYSDAFTGTKADRPEFVKLLGTLKAGDTLIVAKLDRFARSVLDGIKVIDELTEKGITVNVLNIGVIDNTPTGKLIRNIFLAFAEFERDMIVQRTSEGKEISGNYGGRPKKYTTKQLDYALKLKESMSYSQVEEVTGIPKRTLIRYKQEVEK